MKFINLEFLCKYLAHSFEVSSMVEQDPFKVEVVGSNPT